MATKTAQPKILRIVRNSLGQCAVLSDGRTVPALLAGMTVGPDAWMRNILFRCGTCGEPTPAGVLSDSDVPGDCPDCAAAFWCPSCGGHPDDCGNCEG